MIPIFTGARVPACVLKDEVINAHRLKERSIVQERLRMYTPECESNKVHTEVIIAENDSIGLGIVNLIAEHNIGTLIMGAGYYGPRASTGEYKVRTKLATIVEEQAHPSCKLLFVHGGKELSTRSTNDEIPRAAWRLDREEEDWRCTSASSSYSRSESTGGDHALKLEKLDNPAIERLESSSSSDHGSLLSLMAPASLVALNEMVDKMILAGQSPELHQAPFGASCDDEQVRMSLHAIISIDAVLGLEWRNLEEVHWKGYMEYKTIRWLHTLEYVRCVAAVVHRGGQARAQALSAAAEKPVETLLEFATAVSKVSGSPEKLFHMLHMHRALADASPLLVAAFLGDAKERFARELDRTLASLGDAVRGILSKTKALIQSYGGASGQHVVILPDGGGVHVVTSYLARYIELLAQHAASLNVILSGDDSQMSSPEDEEPLDLGRLVAGLIASLSVMLRRTAELYEPQGLRYLFLMNNEHAILQAIDSTGTTTTTPLGAEWVQAYRHGIDHHKLGYIATWATAASCLLDHPTTNATTTSGAGARGFLLRRRRSPPLAEFATSLKKTSADQMHWKADSPQLRGELRRAVRESVVEAYSEFMDKHPNAGKHGEEEYPSVDDLILKCQLDQILEG